jgi:protease-4
MPDRLLTAGFEVGLDRLDPSSYTVSLGSSPVKWLDLNVEYDLTDGSFSAGLALSFSNLKSGAGSSFGSGASLSSGRAFASISPRPYTRPLKGAQEVLLQRYRLDGPIVNARQAAAMGGFHLLSDERTIWQVRKHLERMADDPQVDGIAFINDHPQVSLSTAMELIELLKGFKESGKRIVFYQDYMSITDYLIAAAVGDEIFLHPGGTIDVRGLAISQPYLDRFLARFGVEVENLRSHPYKSSYNFLTEPGMTEAEREAFSMLVASLQRDVTRLVREGRGDRLEISAEKAVDEGPYLVAERALEAGMVDGLIEKDRFTDELSSGGGETVTIRSRMPMDPYRSDWSDPSAEKVAVINAVGNIHTGEGRPGSSIGSETLTAAIRAARKDASVSGILLRVDSGGGSALASAMIAREIELAVTGDNGRGPVPVVVSMGSTAASGGYYISALADKIVASPVTLTGSIGVIGIVPHIEELLRKQQITWEVVKESEQADLGAIYRELTDAERAKLRGAIMNTYDRFVTTVSKGRKMQEAEVDEVARGRIWSGRQAAERGLVDELGGIETALDVLAGEMDTERPLELHDYTYRGVFALMRIGGFSANLLETLEPTPWPAELEAVPPAVRSAYLQLLRGGSLHEHVLTVMPYSFPEIHGK